MSVPDATFLPFATTIDLTNCYDWRRLGELLDDTGTEPSDITEVQDSELALSLLQQGAGEIIAACRVGARYSVLDLLQIIKQNNLSAAFLARLNCDVTVEYICARRMLSVEDTTKFSPRTKEARQMLQLFRDGERVLDDNIVPEAGAHTESINMRLQFRYLPLLSSQRRVYGTLTGNPASGGALNFPYSDRCC